MHVRLASFTLPVLYLYLFKRGEMGREVNELSKDSQGVAQLSP